MPHEVETMAYYGEEPWHGLGTRVPDLMTSAEALRHAGLDWEVELRPVFLSYGTTPADGIYVADRHRAVVRKTDGRYLGIVGKGYRPLQNVEAFRFMDDVVDSGEAKYETAGSLREGRRVWMLARLPKDLLIGGEDAVRQFLLLTNAHDGWAPVTVVATPVRVVCANTLGAALAGARRVWTVRHVGALTGKLSEVRDALGLTFRYFGAFEEIANRLIETTFTDQEVADFLATLFPQAPGREEPAAVTLKARAAVNDILASAPDLARYRQTAWGVWNAAVAYDDGRPADEALRRPIRAQGERAADVALERALWDADGFKARALAAVGTVKGLDLRVGPPEALEASEGA
jgi:phage/plasmid-like protein (TIGR03299 family)